MQRLCPLNIKCDLQNSFDAIQCCFPTASFPCAICAEDAMADSLSEAPVGNTLREKLT